MYFAFPFQLQNPEFLYETQNGYVNPARDMLPGTGLEWFSVQHWEAVKDSEFTAAIILVDAPLVSLGDVLRGTFPAQFWLAQGDGEFVFRCLPRQLIKDIDSPVVFSPDGKQFAFTRGDPDRTVQREDQPEST